MRLDFSGLQTPVRRDDHEEKDIHKHFAISSCRHLARDLSGVIIRIEGSLHSLRPERELCDESLLSC
jgi:hypothetical protein